MSKLRILLARGLLIGLVGAGLVAQVIVVPGLAASGARAFPEVAYLRWPYSIVIILAIACCQAGVFAAWRLVDLLATERPSTDAAVPWVRAVATTLYAASGLLFGLIPAHLVAVGDGLWMIILWAGGCGLILAVVARLIRARLGRPRDKDVPRGVATSWWRSTQGHGTPS